MAPCKYRLNISLLLIPLRSTCKNCFKLKLYGLDKPSLCLQSAYSDQLPWLMHRRSLPVSPRNLAGKNSSECLHKHKSTFLFVLRSCSCHPQDPRKNCMAWMICTQDYFEVWSKLVFPLLMWNLSVKYKWWNAQNLAPNLTISNSLPVAVLLNICKHVWVCRLVENLSLQEILGILQHSLQMTSFVRIHHFVYLLYYSDCTDNWYVTGCMWRQCSLASSVVYATSMRTQHCWRSRVSPPRTRPNSILASAAAMSTKPASECGT